MPEITLSYFKSSHQPWETSQRYKQFSWLQFIASNPFPEFLSPSGSYSRLPVTVAGPQRIDTVFSINAYCNLYPECNADVILTEKIRFHKVFMYSIWVYVSICFCTMNYLNCYIVTVQYPHSYVSKSMKNRLRRWDFDLHVSGFWHIHAKTPRGIVDCWIVTKNQKKENYHVSDQP